MLPGNGYTSFPKAIVKVESFGLCICCNWVKRYTSFWSTEKSTAIGLSDEIVFKTVWPATTDVPGFTRDMPIVPVKGAVIVAKLTDVFTAFTFALAASTCFFAA